jgi:hypothetical protein
MMSKPYCLTLLLGSIVVAGLACNGGDPENGQGNQVEPVEDPTPTHTPTNTPTQEVTSNDGSADQARKVAVLIAAEYSTAPLPGNEEFWYDTVLTYCMLRQNGFTDENIYVLYGFGKDGFYTISQQETSEVVTSEFLDEGDLEPVDYYLQPYCGGLDLNSGIGPLWVNTAITDFSMAFPNQVFGCTGGICRPEQIFECLAVGCDPRTVFDAPAYSADKIDELSTDDFLFVWWKGHGQETGSGADIQHTLSLGGYTVTPEQVNGWLKQIGAGQKLLVFETCHSGCLIDDLGPVQPNEQKMVFVASSDCGEESTRTIQHESGIRHGVWSYWIAGTLQGKLPPFGVNPIYPDSGEPLTVQLSRGGPFSANYTWSEKATHREARDAAGSTFQHPVMRDVTPALAPRTRIDVGDPVSHADSATPTPTDRS